MSKILTTFLILFCNSAFACSPTSEMWANELKENRRLEEAFVKEIASKADFIAVGRVSKVVDNDGIYRQKATIQIEKVLKGDRTKVVDVLMYREPRKEVEKIYVCGQPQKPHEDDAYMVETYKYLFYVQDGILLRSNGFPEAPYPLVPEEEIEFLTKENRITSGGY